MTIFVGKAAAQHSRQLVADALEMAMSALGSAIYGVVPPVGFDTQGHRPDLRLSGQLSIEETFAVGPRG